jgi:Tfp pilus assembly protein PilZ
MERTHVIAGTPEVKIAVRVRGMSHDHRYLDELVSTTHLTQDFIVIRLRERVDPDSEVHITNMHTMVGGTYRVAWINTRAKEGLHSVGLELLDPEGEIWEPDSIPEHPEVGDPAPVALLECQRCLKKVSTPVPEAEIEALSDGFSIARHCDFCKATTVWAYLVEKPHATEAPAHRDTASAHASVHRAIQAAKEQRVKGRAPIHLPIKTIRDRYGLFISDVGETINVSRTGVYFATDQSYEVGADVNVIMPYHPNSIAIPVKARVVRQDEPREARKKRVAVHLISGGNP